MTIESIEDSIEGMQLYIDNVPKQAQEQVDAIQRKIEYHKANLEVMPDSVIDKVQLQEQEEALTRALHSKAEVDSIAASLEAEIKIRMAK